MQEYTITDINAVKDTLSNPKYSIVCFDLFDTLIKYPFSDRQHLFYFLDKEYENSVYSTVCFHTIRENIMQLISDELTWRDIERIYQDIHEKYKIERCLCEKLKTLELKLLIDLSCARNSFKEIYNYALLIKKKVIVTSTSCYSHDTICRILAHNGYAKWTDIFVLEEVDKSAATDNLLTRLTDQFSVDPSSVICFVGQHCNKCIKTKTKIVQVPNPSEILLSKINMCICSELIDLEKLTKSLGFGCLVALAANSIFDNPYYATDIPRWSTNDYFWGYYVLGMHLLAITKWIIKETSTYKEILFMSRDGWLVKEAYDILLNGNTALPKSKYIYISRRMMLPYLITGYSDMVEFPSLDRVKATPRVVFNLLSFCTKNVLESEKEQFCVNISLGIDEAFGSINSYLRFIKSYYNELYCPEKHQLARHTISEYWKDIQDNSIAFDLGNYGRVHSALVRATSKKIDALFIYADGRQSVSEMRKNKFDIKTFFDFYPSNLRQLREYYMSHNAPSCISLIHSSPKHIAPVFSEYNNNPSIAKIHAGALQFIRDYCRYFRNYEDVLDLKSFELSLLFESALRGFGWSCNAHVK